MYLFKNKTVVALNIAPQYREAFIKGSYSHDCSVYLADNTKVTIKRVGQLTYKPAYTTAPASMKEHFEREDTKKQELEQLFVNGLKISR